VSRNRPLPTTSPNVGALSIFAAGRKKRGATAAHSVRSYCCRLRRRHPQRSTHRRGRRGNRLTMPGSRSPPGAKTNKTRRSPATVRSAITPRPLHDPPGVHNRRTDHSGTMNPNTRPPHRTRRRVIVIASRCDRQKRNSQKCQRDHQPQGFHKDIPKRRRVAPARHAFSPSIDTSLWSCAIIKSTSGPHFQRSFSDRSMGCLFSSLFPHRPKKRPGERGFRRGRDAWCTVCDGCRNIAGPCRPFSISC